MASVEPVSGSRLRGGGRRRGAGRATWRSTTSCDRASRCRRRGARARSGSRCTGCSRSPTRWRRRRRRCGAASRSTAWWRRWPPRTGSPLRMEVRHVPGGPVLVVDCYNANPASTEAALRSLAALPAGRKLALLGLMAELGAETEAEHRRIAPLAEELGIEVVGYQTGALRLGRGDAASTTRSRCCGRWARATPPSSRAAGWRGSRTSCGRYGAAAGAQSLAAGAWRGRCAVGQRGADEDPTAEARRRATRCAATASCPDRARRPGAGTRATRGGAGRRRLRRPPAPWRRGRAPRCRARRAGLLEAPAGQVEEPGVGGQRGHGAGGVDEHGGDAPAVALGLPPRVPRQRVGQRLALDQVERGAEVGDGHGRVRLRLRLGGQRHGAAARRRSPGATPGRGRCASRRERGDRRARRRPWRAGPRTPC